MNVFLPIYCHLIFIEINSPVVSCVVEGIIVGHKAPKMLEQPFLCVELECKSYVHSVTFHCTLPEQITPSRLVTGAGG